MAVYLQRKRSMTNSKYSHHTVYEGDTIYNKSGNHKHDGRSFTFIDYNKVYVLPFIIFVINFINNRIS